MRFIRNCWTLAVPFIVLLGVASWLFWPGQPLLARLVSNAGTMLVLFGNFIYIVFFHSKSRWPKLGWRERASKVVTLQR